MNEIKCDKLHNLQVEIDKREKYLKSTDYKVIKAMEYSLLGKECEYNMEEVSVERQLFRDQINQFEAELAELEKE